MVNVLIMLISTWISKNTITNICSWLKAYTYTVILIRLFEFVRGILLDKTGTLVNWSGSTLHKTVFDTGSRWSEYTISIFLLQHTPVHATVDETLFILS